MTRLLADPLVTKIGAAHGKSSAQTCVRYAIQHGIVPLPKSTHAERIAANAEVFDFALSDEVFDGLVEEMKARSKKEGAAQC